MKPINGFKAEAPTNNFQMLPKGLYIATIQNVKLEGSEPDQQLILRLEITEGEYAGYYTKRYHADSSGNSRFPAKYKGDYRLQIPNPDNTRRQHPEWDQRTFSGAIWAIEDSNEGYHWDWNEAGLKGKAVGINVRQGTYNGSPYTTIGRLESVQQIRAGAVKVMKDMEPRGDRGVTVETSTTVPGFTPVDDEEVPF